MIEIIERILKLRYRQECRNIVKSAIHIRFARLCDFRNELRFHELNPKFFDIRGGMKILGYNIYPC